MIEIQNECIKNLLPIPVKAHYLFNLRDIWKVFLGFCSLSPKKSNEPLTVARGWVHEVTRVIGDRLTDAPDQERLQTILKEKIVDNFKLDPEEVFNQERIVFGYFMNKGEEDQPYEEITKLEGEGGLKQVLTEYNEDYNEETTAKMNLVIFLDFAEHISRIARVLQQPSGNVLLLGVGGSGRQSSARLACFINDVCRGSSDQSCYQVEVAKGYGRQEFKDDIKSCLMRCGAEDKVQGFLFCDTQIVFEDFVEMINNVLSSGDVPNMYKTEDMDPIMTAGRQLCTAAKIQPTKANMFAAYVNRVKKNLHVILAFSYVGDAFRTRLRMFPSLINCCTIDWFHEWPAEALFSVAKQQLEENNVELADPDAICGMFRSVHLGVQGMSKDFLAEKARHVYVTPTSFLELLAAYRGILGEIRAQKNQRLSRYDVGLTKIMDAEEQVAGLQEELVKLLPQVEQTVKEVGKLIVEIDGEKEKAAEAEALAGVEEAKANEKAAECKEIKESAEAGLAEALPALAIADQAIKKLKKDHLREVKALANPPGGVRLCMEVVCIMFQQKPVKKADPNNPGKKINDYWETSQKVVLADPEGLLNSLTNRRVVKNDGANPNETGKYVADPTGEWESVMDGKGETKFAFDRDAIPESVVNLMGPYIENPDFMPEAIKKASLACEAMCMWARAMYKYHFVAKEVEPKRIALAAANAELEETMAVLANAQATLKEVQDKVAALDKQFEAANAEKEALEAKKDNCEKKMARAHKLTGGLGGEKIRWGQIVKDTKFEMDFIAGDALIAAGMISYAGPFITKYRNRMMEEWYGQMTENNISFNPGATLKSVLGDPIKIQQWVVDSLPNDNLSVENGIIIDKTRRWPLMIDPQRQANKFIRKTGENLLASNGEPLGIDIFKLSDNNFLRTMELAVQFGKWALLENIGIDLDPALEPVLMQQKVKDGSSWSVKLGDKSVNWTDTFKFFLTTTLPNPHYSPETSVKVTLINFAITPVGLEDQMLGIVVQKERQDLQDLKDSCMKASADGNAQLKALEDQILKLLSESAGEILEDDVVVNAVTEATEVGKDVKKKMAESEQTEKEIDDTRETFRPVAFRAQTLFFCVTELAKIDPMYQFSLQWFQLLFVTGIGQTPESDDPKHRLELLSATFTALLYNTVCTGLFEKDKSLFSFALCTRILDSEKKLNNTEFRFLMTGPTSNKVDESPLKKPALDWVDEPMWNEILSVDEFEAFNGVAKLFSESPEKFKHIYDSHDAHKEAPPAEFSHLDSLERLCLLRCLRLDCLSDGVVDFISEKIGQEFVEPPTFNIEKSFAAATNLTPLIFILSSGSDPVGDVMEFANKMDMGKRIESISLGQGQGPKAQKLISLGQDSGGWVLLSNCHLAASWMSSLEALVEQMNPETIHEKFRLWLTSMPSNVFPVQVLQVGVKMTNEPPKGLRANLMRTYSNMDPNIFEGLVDGDGKDWSEQKVTAFRKLLFGFCFFHAVAQDRRKYGPIGWNIPYAFTNEDIMTCRRQLQFFVGEYEEVPYKVLTFLGAAINYGGRVTDSTDKRLIMSIINTFINSDTVENAEYKFSDSGLFYCPDEATTPAAFLEYIKGMPLAPAPEAFGMHSNCNISCARTESNSLLEGMLTVSDSGSGGSAGKSKEDVMDETAENMLKRTPAPFNLELVERQFPTDYDESMNTVLKQECIRYNKLLTRMAEVLPLFRRALKGLVAMTPELDAMGNSMFNNMVPDMWSDVGPLSLKPLASWIVDVNDRVDFLNGWYENGTPKCYWVSGLFFPQAFFTGATQNFARKHQMPIDTISFNFIIADDKTPDDINAMTMEQVKEQEGVYAYGIFLEGGRWESTLHELSDALPKQLYSELPLTIFEPQQDRTAPTSGIYMCPIYKVLSRRGTLMTTGHSTNFVMFMELATQRNQDMWIKTGLAGFLALAS
jgi:dynein heavy chain